MVQLGKNRYEGEVINHNTSNTPSNLEQGLGNEQVAKKKTKRFPTPCSIHIHSIRRRLADCDGISGKAAIDGLVHAGILKDDSTKYVKEVTFSQERGKEEKTIITLRRVN